MVEVKTGEGKSMIIAIVAIIFSLRGYKAYCACYSSLLSARDEESFRSLFLRLGVSQNIFYGTFYKLCEEVINEEAQIRDQLKDFILNKKTPDFKQTEKNKVLIIDEVDVLFDPRYIGVGYSMSTKIEDDLIVQLIKKIWSKRGNSNTTEELKEIKISETYIKIERNYPNLKDVLHNAVKFMITDRENFKCDHELKDGKVGRTLNGEFFTNVLIRYKTAFFHLDNESHISSETLNRALFLNINCGTFSYLELAKEFSLILGVTGTLCDLPAKQTELINSDQFLAVKEKTVIPSVFGSNIREFDPKNDFKIFDDPERHFNHISDLLQTCISKSRPVLVFFKTRSDINEFKVHLESKNIYKNVEILTDTVEPEIRKNIIIRAGNPGRITLCTREMGRGIDFLCKDKNVEKIGGILVIQTFPSEEKSEEIQIQGRCARQGKPGSYSLILLLNDLNSFGVKSVTESHNQVFAKRDQYYDSKLETLFKDVTELKSMHQESKMIKESLKRKDKAQFFTYVNRLNKQQIQPKETRTLILIDGTASMGELIILLKENLDPIFKATNVKLREEKIKDGLIKIQIAIYRDYDCLEEILEVSSWKNNPGDLIQFLEKIEVFGGEDYPEAVEIGLQYANKLFINGGLSQIILIADASPKEIDQIIKDRQKYKGEEFWTNLYGPPTVWQEEIKPLKENQIPVNTFYLRKEHSAISNKESHFEIEDAKFLEQNFKKISEETHGRSFYLDLEKPESKEELKSCISYFLLKSIDENLIQDHPAIGTFM
jgi:hypothetical protein